MSCQLLDGKYPVVIAGDVLVEADRVLAKWYVNHILLQGYFVPLDLSCKDLFKLCIGNMMISGNINNV